jgi:hypothetical protein
MEAVAHEKVKTAYYQLGKSLKVISKSTDANVVLEFFTEGLELYVRDRRHPESRLFLAENASPELFSWDVNYGLPGVDVIEQLMEYLNREFRGSKLTGPERTARLLDVLSLAFSPDRMQK